MQHVSELVNYCDSTNKGRIGMAAISNCEILEVHRMHLEITMANMHCGFFHLRIELYFATI